MWIKVDKQLPPRINFGTIIVPVLIEDINGVSLDYGYYENGKWYGGWRLPFEKSIKVIAWFDLSPYKYNHLEL
jgi:hypothetical protein